MKDVILFFVFILSMVIPPLLIFYTHKLKKEVKQLNDSIVEDYKANTQKILDSIQLDQTPQNILMKQTETKTMIDSINESAKIINEKLENLHTEIKTDNTTSSMVLSDVSSRIIAMNDIMVNKKSRGNWGEYQLNTLLSTYAGENQNIFEVQYPLKNGYIGDVALHLPDNKKVLMIDSKFPMENFEKLQDETIEDKKYESLFKQNIKKHINDISKKYITPETVDLAVMFIPSEAVYFQVCAYHSDLIDYAHQKHVLITCPTTLIGVVFTLVNATKEFNRSKHIKDIEKHIVMMEEDTKRLVARLDKVQSASDSLAKALKDAQTSAGKIDARVTKISAGVDLNDED